MTVQLFNDTSASIIQKVDTKALNFPSMQLFVKREDLLHPTISGNKFRKLKYNVLQAQAMNLDSLLTFGGAFSNHIVATAAVGNACGLKTIGVIRGDELSDSIRWGHSLREASALGMQFYFVSRAAYKDKDTPAFQEQLKQRFGSFYLLPEGGTNELAIKGSSEIMDASTQEFDTLCVSVGTGGTLAGILQGKEEKQRLIGFSALKGDFQKAEIARWVPNKAFDLIAGYHFGGYAKIELEFIRFINTFYQKTGIPLDPVYTGKMMYGILDLFSKGLLTKNNRILAIHTGGLQGIRGMNDYLKTKNWPQIRI